MNQAYKLSFKKIGHDVTIWEKAHIIAPEKISIGDSVIIDDFTLISGKEDTILGSFIHIGAFSSLVGGGRLLMEDFSGLSGGVRIYTGNEDYSGACLTNPAVPYPFRKPIRSFVTIKKHAIIGANSVILPGVTVGQGAVVGANSLVKKDCEPWKIYFGSPAKAIGTRPKDEILRLEDELRGKIYDLHGNYIKKNEREKNNGE